MSPSARSFKQLAHQLIDNLPDGAGWPDLIDHAAQHQDTLENDYLSEPYGYDSRIDESVLREYDAFMANQHLEEEEDTIDY